MMEPKIWFNGEIISAKSIGISELRRAFQYGDGLFESMKFENGKIRHLDYHLERLKKGLKMFRIEIPAFIESDYIHDEALKLCEKNNCGEEARFRMFAWRAGEAMYMPLGDSANVMMECSPFVASDISLDFSLGIYTEAQKPLTRFSEYKNMNASLYVAAGIFCRENNFHECLIMNAKGRVCESLYSNVFIIKKGEILSPDLEEACIGGVMRRVVFEHCIRNNYSVKMTSLSLEDIILADEIFLTNAVKGIQSVKKFHGKEYQTQITQKIREEIFRV